MGLEGTGAVTLDLFGTLVDFSIWRDEPPLVETLLDELGVRFEAEEVLQVWLDEALTERARTPFRTVRTSLAVGAQVVAERFAVDLDPDRWAERLEGLWSRRPLREQAAASIDRLQAAGVATAIVTNLDRHLLEVVLARTGLDTRVQAAVCSQDVKAYKPDPAPFEAALERLEVPPSRAVHVGDSEREDLPGAEAAGMLACVLVEEAGGLAPAVDQAMELLRA